MTKNLEEVQIAIIESARKIDEYISKNDYYYSASENEIYNNLYDSGTNKATSGVAFVNWCLIDSGAMEQEKSEKTSSVIKMLDEIFNELKWTEISQIQDVSDLQEGDVCFYLDASRKCISCKYLRRK